MSNAVTHFASLDIKLFRSVRYAYFDKFLYLYKYAVRISLVVRAGFSYVLGTFFICETKIVKALFP